MVLTYVRIEFWTCRGTLNSFEMTYQFTHHRLRYTAGHHTYRDHVRKLFMSTLHVFTLSLCVVEIGGDVLELAFQTE